MTDPDPAHDRSQTSPNFGRVLFALRVEPAMAYFSSELILSVEELIPIASKFEGISEDTCDVPVCEDPSTFDALHDHSEILSDPNDDGTSSDDDDFEDIEYVSLEEVNDVDQEEKEFDLENILQIQDVILREKLLNINRLIANIESLNDNSTPNCVLKSPSPFPTPVSNSFFEKSDTSLSYSDNSLPEFESFSDHTEETSSGNTTTHANNSFPEYDSFHFEIKPDQGGLTSIVMEDILLWENLVTKEFGSEERFLKIKQAMEEEQNQPEVLQELLLKLMNDLQILKGSQKRRMGEGKTQGFIHIWYFSMTWMMKKLEKNYMKDIAPSWGSLVVYLLVKDALTDKQYRQEDIQELMSKLLEDVQNISEEFLEYINCPSWNHHLFYDYDDDEYTIIYSKPKTITPDLPIEEPDNSLSMGDKHLDTIPSVENLVPIPNVILRDKLLNINRLIANIKSLNDNSTPHCVLKSTSSFPTPVSNSFFEKSNTSLSYSDNSLPEFESFSDHTKETSNGSTTTHANNSLLEYDSFHFEIEPDQDELTNVVMEDILGEPRVHVPNVIPQDHEDPCLFSILQSSGLRSFAYFGILNPDHPRMTISSRLSKLWNKSRSNPGKGRLGKSKVFIPYWNFSMIDDEEAGENFMKDICTFLRKFSRIPFGVTPKVILIA
ncbi:hypothetical protein Tco_1110522 [Tanacetum coccineum]|uniref:Uncharacterized protein n=1 Tax=Tanacetum coccineum TaxID=301880 RepID=A0ABQ5IJA3_9ASTR